jgi:hypothetical protein
MLILDVIDRRDEAAAVTGLTSGSAQTMRAINHRRADFLNAEVASREAALNQPKQSNPRTEKAGHEARPVD